MGKVVSLRDKMETWSTAYTSPAGDVIVGVSSHGRISIATQTGGSHVLDFVEGVRFLSGTSETLEDIMSGMQF